MTNTWQITYNLKLKKRTDRLITNSFSISSFNKVEKHCFLASGWSTVFSKTSEELATNCLKWPASELQKRHATSHHRPQSRSDHMLFLDIDHISLMYPMQKTLNLMKMYPSRDTFK